VLLIAHRADLVRRADRIVVLEHGAAAPAAAPPGRAAA
jgi:ABC-type multidrug transport system fused ATPase/permease subunit